MPQKLIIDADPGIGDAIAVALALIDPEVEVVGLTATAGQVAGPVATHNLQAITAVVIGGTSLFGGVGTILGTVVGVLIPTVLQYGFVILRVQPFWQTVAVGVVLVAAVYVDQLKRSARDRL